MGQQKLHTPRDTRAMVAVDLGAESCRVSLLRWREGKPELALIHRFANGPREHNGLRWPLHSIEKNLNEGLQRCAVLAPEGIQSLAVDGWAVDYVRVNTSGNALAEPFCYRDERTVAAFDDLHRKITIQRMHEITGIQIARINTLYQLYADKAAGLPEGSRWLNLPEYMLTRWGADAVAEYTNATHTQLVDIRTRTWSPEIFAAAGLDLNHAPVIVSPGSIVGKLSGDMRSLSAFRDTKLIAPACHDTASAIAGIPAAGDDWAYISSGTWSLIGTLLDEPCTTAAALEENFTNLGAVGGKTCFHKGVNGMWLLKQCMDCWAAEGSPWELNDLIAAAQDQPSPHNLLDVNDPDLMLMGKMPQRINEQRLARGLSAIETSSADAPQMVALLFHSLAAEYATVLDRVEHHTGRSQPKVVIVGGGSRNDLLCRLIAERTGRTVLRGSAESSTIGNLAVQLAVSEAASPSNSNAFAEEVSSWAGTLLKGGLIVSN